MATSAPVEEPGTLVGSASGVVRAPEPRHVSVLLDREAVAEANEVWVRFRWPQGEAHDVIAIVPDDDTLPELQLVTDDPEMLDATAACRDARGCSVGFTLDPAFAEPGPTVATVEVTVEAIRYGGEFSPDAVVEVVFDDD